MKNKITKSVYFGCLVLGMVWMTGCVSRPSMYIRSQPLDIDGHVKVAIVPFSNLTQERDADKKVTYSLITHFLKSTYFDVVPMGETQKALREAKVREGEDLALEQIKKIGELTEADVLFMGVVDEYKIDSSTLMGEKVFVPEVSICVRLVSARSGGIIWSSNHHRRGDDQVSMFGVGRIDSISSLTDVIIKDTFRALTKTLNEQQEVLAVLRSTHPLPGDLPTEAAPDEKSESVQMEVELLRKEKAVLFEELTALKKKLQEAETAAPAAEKEVLTSPPPKPLELKPPDERALVKTQYESERVNIKKQY